MLDLGMEIFLVSMLICMTANAAEALRVKIQTAI